MWLWQTGAKRTPKVIRPMPIFHISDFRMEQETGSQYEKNHRMLCVRHVIVCCKTVDKRLIFIFIVIG